MKDQLCHLIWETFLVKPTWALLNHFLCVFFSLLAFRLLGHYFETMNIKSEKALPSAAISECQRLQVIFFQRHIKEYINDYIINLSQFCYRLWKHTERQLSKGIRISLLVNLQQNSNHTENHKNVLNVIPKKSAPRLEWFLISLCQVVKDKGFISSDSVTVLIN
jgi:hypothetical protein